MSSRVAKAEARVAAKARREIAQAALGPEARSRFADLFFAHIPLATDDVVAGYAPIGSEADPVDILRRVAARGHPVALPCVEARKAALTFRLWTCGAALVAGPHGTRAPSREAPEVEPRVLLVPLLAFDGRGHRLGYGGGYYDRTLAGLRMRSRGILAVGLAFAGQEVTHIPIEPDDEPLDWIVTEREAKPFTGRTS
jgi:5-formyltetrahydrofolate cyclo-ligase